MSTPPSSFRSARVSDSIPWPSMNFMLTAKRRFPLLENTHASPESRLAVTRSRAPSLSMSAVATAIGVEPPV